MRNIKIAISFMFVIAAVVALAGQALGYPPYMAKARKYGGKDCTFCHVDPEGGPPWNARGQWLIDEKERRGADAIDVDWLAEYKPGKQGKKSEAPKSKDNKPADQGEEKKADQAPPQASPGASTATASVEQELLKLEREWLDAYANRDVAAMERIVADDFTITYPNGKVLTKADEIAGLKMLPSAGPRPALSTEETKVRVYGDTAVLTGVFVQKGTHADGPNKGQEYTIKERYTDVYVKRNGQWQVVASHLTSIGPPPAPPQQPPPPASPAKPAAKVDPKVYDDYVGQYETPFGPLNIMKEGDKLFGQPEGESKEELVPESESVFNVANAGVNVTFVKDASGKVTHMIIKVGGQEAQAKKVK